MASYTKGEMNGGYTPTLTMNGGLTTKHMDVSQSFDMNGDVTKLPIDFSGVDMTSPDTSGANNDKELDDNKEIDKFDINNIDFSDVGTPWAEMTTKQRVVRMLLTIFGICFALGLLYIFICSLDILTSAFQLMAGRVASDAFANSVILNNPMAGLMIGVLATVLLQSSSTSTSIVVTLVGSGVLTVEQAIYIIMGANIGTSVTNTIVSLTQSVDEDIFRRSFAGATVHDMFNWLTVLLLLPLEAASGYLHALTGAIVKHIEPSDTQSDEPEFLKVITNPLTKRIIKVDKKVLSAVAEDTDRAKYPLCQYYCGTSYADLLKSWPSGQENQTFIEEIQNDMWTIDVTLTNDTILDKTNLTWRDLTNESYTCSHLFTGCGDVEGTSCGLSDLAVGGILLACSLTILLSSVIILVKVLSFILRGPMAKAIRIGINAEFPGKGKYFTGYVAMLIGAGFTMLVQSSSVFTSTLTPLVGMGLISVERMFPLTLGANIGTCVTGILAALASDPAKIQNTMQVALAHLFFNISGIIIYYPVPFMRRLPIRAAKLLGNTTAKYRWFAVAYVLFVFLLIPGAVFGLSLAGWQVLVGVLAPVAAVIISVVIVKLMQNYCPQKMHPKLRDWKWLPEPLRSLAPCNNVITRCCYNENCVRCRRKCSCKENEPDVDVESVSEPPMYCEEVIASNTAHNDSHFGQKNLGFEDINLNEQTLQTRL